METMAEWEAHFKPATEVVPGDVVVYDGVDYEVFATYHDKRGRLVVIVATDRTFIWHPDSEPLWVRNIGEH